MPERPSREPASQGLRPLDGQPVTALIGFSETATESRGKISHQLNTQKPAVTLDCGLRPLWGVRQIQGKFALEIKNMI